jgi:predicted MFS family arabinose efflux permease
LLQPFQVRSFRFQWPADLATSWAMEMEVLILGWYVLVETGSVLWLTVFGSLQFTGTLLAPLFGVLGDRIGPRNLLCVMRGIYATLAAAMTTFALLDVLSPVHVFAIAALSGAVRPSDQVMRNALVGETMPADRLMGAMSIARTTADSARVAGALAGAGMVAMLGMGPAYVAIASLYAISVLLTLGVANSRGGSQARVAGRPSPTSPWRDLRDALSYVWTRPPLLAAMCLAFLVNMTAFPLSGGLLPYVAKDVYLIDRTGLGYLVASFAFGGLVGSIILGKISNAIRPARMMLIFASIWYAMLVVFAQQDRLMGGMLMLLLCGMAASFAMVPMSVLLLRAAAAELRVRVMGLRMLAVYGLPVGLLVAGPLIQAEGFAFTATLYGAVGLLFTALIGLRWRRHLWPLEAPSNSR